MDATGLNASKAWLSTLTTYLNPPGFDHTLIWRDENGYAITTEPYIGSGNEEKVQQFCEVNGFKYERRDVWSMWNPYSNCKGTCLFLIFPKEKPANREKIIEGLDMWLKRNN
jgi:hypothetical protein